MRQTIGPPFGGVGGGLRATPWVKRLLTANAAVFLVTAAVGIGTMADLFAFSPSRLLERPWGMLTYMFVHAGLWHLLMNMLVIFFFGPPLERRWGSDFFIKFYLVCGLGGVALSFLFADASIVGASAACYGIMLAFAMAWPDAPIHVWGVVPVRAKWVVGFLAALTLASALGPGRDGIAHLAHFGGVVTGFLLVKSGRAPVRWGDAGAGRSGRATATHAGRAATRGAAERGRRGRLRRRGGSGFGFGPAGDGPGLRARYDAFTLRAAAWLARMKPGEETETGRPTEARPPASGSAGAATKPSEPGRGQARQGPRHGSPGRPRPERGQARDDRTIRIHVRRTETRAIPMPPVREKRRMTAAEERAELDALDAVLDKISASGIGSLTDSERALLDRVSRREKTN